MGFIPVGDSPNDIVFTPDGTRAYVTNFNDDNVQVIDTASNTIIGLPIPVGDGANRNAITPDGSRVYVTNFVDSTVSVIETTINTVIGSPIPVGAGPNGIAITPNGLRAYVANSTDGTVSVIDTASNTVLGLPIPVGLSPGEVAITRIVRECMSPISQAPPSPSSIPPPIWSLRPSLLGLTLPESRLPLMVLGPMSRMPALIRYPSFTLPPTRLLLNDHRWSRSERHCDYSDGTRAYITNFQIPEISIINTSSTRLPQYH